jgi:hypothetical protein
MGSVNLLSDIEIIGHGELPEGSATYMLRLIT